MSLAWEDLIARVRGLGTHLFDWEQLDDLARCRDLNELVRRLEQCGLVIGSAGGAEDIERAVRRTAAGRMALLARWAGPRNLALRIIFEDEDRRSLRGLLRGLVGAVPAPTRLAGLIPTPSLPARGLEQLAALHRPGEFAALLVAWGNPYGRVLLDHLSSPEPDLLEAELAVARRWATRVVEGAEQGDTMLQSFVAESLDIENITTALLLAGAGYENPLDQCFLPGGTQVGLPLFRRSAEAPDLVSAQRYLLEGLAGRSLAGVIASLPAEFNKFEVALLRYRIERLHRRSRLEPLSTAPVLGYALRVRYEVIMLQRIIWGLSLGAPAATLTQPARVR